MLRRQVTCLGAFRREVKPVGTLPVPCAQRWDLRLTRARLWGEHIETGVAAGVNQVQDMRHMSPEFPTFIGHPTREMQPGTQQLTSTRKLLEKRLPNHSAHELHSKRDIPHPVNAMYGKAARDEAVYGTEPAYAQKMYKSMQRASRNDRKLKGNKFRVTIGSGAKSPPEGFSPIPDGPEEED